MLKSTFLWRAVLPEKSLGHFHDIGSGETKTDRDRSVSVHTSRYYTKFDAGSCRYIVDILQLQNIVA